MGILIVWSTFINNKIEVKLLTKSPAKILKYLKNFNINIYHIKYNPDDITIIINHQDYAKINKFFNTKIIKEYGVKQLKNFFSQSKISIIYFISFLILTFFLTRIIIDIDVLTNNNDLSRTILNELDKNGIQKYTFIKHDKDLLSIRDNILANQRELLEWINIERSGMKYLINVEPRKDKNKELKQDYCHIVSIKDAIITRIITSSGTELKEVNDSVKKDDIIISGDISYNNEIKSHVCASGTVYGHTWYTINISLPKTYEKITELDKTRYNLELKYHNKNNKIFKSRLKEFSEKKQKIINLFGIELNLVKEKEVAKEYLNYTEDELNENINKLVIEKMNTTLEGDYQIIEQKVLKKNDNNSTIDIELFIVAEEQISKPITASLETEIIENN